MPIGPGKYDALCAKAREDTDAFAVLLIIFGGNKGDGFSMTVKATLPEHLAMARRVPSILRAVADDIERDLASVKGHA